MSTDRMTLRRGSLPASRHAFTFLAITAIVTAAACSATDTTSTSGSANIAGAYTLQSVNASAMPATLTNTYTQNGVTYTDKQTWNSGSLAMNADNTFRVIFAQVYTESAPGSNTFTENRTDTTNGTWSLSGSTLTIHFTDNGTARTLTGSYVDPVVTITAVDTSKDSQTGTIHYVETQTFAFKK